MNKTLSRILLRLSSTILAAVAVFAFAGIASAAPCNPSQASCITPGDYEFTTSHDGYDWTYLVHVPASYDGTKPVALLLNLHGDNGTAADYRTQDGQLAESDTRGYIAVWPQAHKLPGSAGGFWNGNGCCFPDGFPANIDSVGFIRKIVTEMKARANIDDARVFIVGGSAGAAMVHRIACDAPDLARAFVAYSHVLSKPELCHPTRGVNLYIIHGLLDWLVPYVGNPVLGFASAPASFESWRVINGCTGSSVRTPVGLVSYTDTYKTCNGGTSLSLTTITTGSHTANVNLEGYSVTKHMWTDFLVNFN